MGMKALFPPQKSKEEHFPLFSGGIIAGQALYRLKQHEVAQFPYNLIGVITGKDNAGRPFRGTGTLLSEDLVLTVAHCIFEGKTYGQDYKQLRFYPAAYGTVKEQKGIQFDDWRYLPEFKNKKRDDL